ncbi:homogentisate 1,2-dioxygenase [Cladophialophora carrionii CBS 160.54]|uniref:homogentisate 1,2-dioxygenase n=1 Tax=Cladophialophora carrionii CBS 160.54 TaxID=1279043 RepID=V9D620_9EURO|nr:homogentisate 1,2-dioxygenase [Cladophialophora carrionii CBS 160.54]ETI21748.1 homogentisate 1,2-dioxygenase [Cladophialophora carrionii CBS 160.54]
MPPVTHFALKEKYEYHDGLGNHHRSEAVPGAVPVVNNHPQIPPLGLRTEKISGTSFVGPRAHNLFTYLYRIESSYQHTEFTEWNHDLEFANPAPAKHLNPNSTSWRTYPFPEKGDWMNQRLLASNGNAQQKTGIAVWVFNAHKDMAPQTAFTSLDGEALIVPQFGSLDITTELGKLLVRPNEIAVIPRGMRYRVTLPEGKPCRGHICELYQGHYRLPELGIIGTTGLANSYDFQVPTASFEGQLERATNGDQIPVANNGANKWTIISRLDTKLWTCSQVTTPFNVVGWQGTLYPYKYDLARFDTIGNLRYGHVDPSVYVLLTAPAFGKAPGTAVVDFIGVPPRWQAADDTFGMAWFHRNTMQEFGFPVINDQRADTPLNNPDTDFSPFGGYLNGAMATHGPDEPQFQAMRAKDTRTPSRYGNEKITICAIETECPLYLTDWAHKSAERNLKAVIEEYFRGKQLQRNPADSK